MPTAADDAFCCQGPAKILIPETWWKVGLLAGSMSFVYEPHCYSCRSEGDLDLSEKMCVSFLRRRLSSVLHLLHRVCAIFCATEAVALTVMLLSLPLRCPGILSLQSPAVKKQNARTVTLLSLTPTCHLNSVKLTGIL